MHRILLCCFAVLAAAPSAARAQPAPASSVTFAPAADGSIASERVRNVTYRRITTDGENAHALLVVDHEWWVDAEAEESASRMQVRALGWDGAAFARLLWTVEAAADRAEVEWGFLRLTSDGCCDLDQTHTLYDLAGGREVAWFTAEPVYTYNQEGGALLVTYESPQSIRLPEGASTRDAQGVVRVVLGGRITDEVLLRGGTEGEAGYIHGTGTFCDADGRVRMRAPDPVGPGRTVHVCYQFESGAWAVLPVRGGRVLLEDARLPAGVTARRGGW